jgi:hypothetical protein
MRLLGRGITKMTTNKNIFKRFLAVLTAVCFILGFALVPVNAADYVIDPNNTLVFGSGNLFGDTPVLYPGESSEFTIRIDRPADTNAIVTMSVTKLNERTHPELANFIWLTISNTTDGSIVYSGKLSDFDVHSREIILSRRRISTNSTLSSRRQERLIPTGDGKTT